MSEITIDVETLNGKEPQLFIDGISCEERVYVDKKRESDGDRVKIYERELSDQLISRRFSDLKIRIKKNYQVI